MNTVPSSEIKGTIAFPSDSDIVPGFSHGASVSRGRGENSDLPGRGGTFGGRTDNAQIPAELVTKLNEKFGGEANAQMFEQMFGEKEVILFGEGYGRKIQKGGGNYIPDGVDFILFDVLIGENYLDRANVESIAQAMDIKVVPIVGRGSLYEAVEYVKKNPVSVVAEGRCKMEGVVVRPKLEMRDRRGNRLIVKVKWEDMKELI